MLIPGYTSQEKIYDPKYQAFVSLLAGFFAFANTGIQWLLAILSALAGLIGITYSVKKKRWGWLAANIFGFLFGIIVILAKATGQEF